MMFVSVQYAFEVNCPEKWCNVTVGIALGCARAHAVSAPAPASTLSLLIILRIRQYAENLIRHYKQKT